MRPGNLFNPVRDATIAGVGSIVSREVW